MTGDDAEARRRRAEQLRRGIREPPDARPPRSPREFIEREMRERAEQERDEDEAPPDRGADADD